MMKSASFAAIMALLFANVEAKGIYDANSYIGNWLNSTAFFGIFFMVIFFFTCYCVLQTLA